MGDEQKHVIAVTVENHMGVLARVSGLFAARGFNIDSLAVGETEDPTISRMTIVVRGDDRTLEQVRKQLQKLIDVIHIEDLTKAEFVDRELILVRVAATPETQQEVEAAAKEIGAVVHHAGSDGVVLELAGDQQHVQGLLERMAPYGIKELIRTGRIAIAKNSAGMKKSK